MTSLDVLLDAPDGEFLGVYRERDQGGEPFARLAVYRAMTASGDGSGTDVYKFRPVAETGDEFDFDGHAVVVAEVEHPHAESDGHTHASVAVAAGGVEAAPDSPATSVFKSKAEFRNLLGLLTAEDHPDLLDLDPHDTNLSAEGMQHLGFSATGQPEIVTLDLHPN